jgi:hypothetical protein
VSAAILPVLLSFVLIAAPAGAQSSAEDGWNVNETAHFVIHHERPEAVLGDYNRIEQIYEALHSELWSFAPWMAAEKTHIYLYKDPDSYLRGRFHPPPWSGGLLQTSDGVKTLAIFEPVDTGIVAHELTHLYFHSYFDEKQASPPAWLDEGLASMLQEQGLSQPDPLRKGPVLSAVAPLKDLMLARPGADAPAGWVGGWYRQSQSVVWYLKRGRNEASFVNFCAHLRDGEDAESALREAYGDDDVSVLDAAWQKWRPTKRAGELKGIGDQ